MFNDASGTIENLSRVRMPLFVLLDIAEVPDASRNFIAIANPQALTHAAKVLLDGRAVRLIPDPAGPKLGTLGRWIAAVYERDIFLQQTRYDPGGGYADGASVECFTGDRYTELETLSAQAALPIGARLSNTVNWEVLPRPEGSDQELVEILTQR